MSKIGERLMVHPTSVTSLMDRLVADGLVDRQTDPQDRRRVLASLTDAGKRVLDQSTAVLTELDFGLGALPKDQQQAVNEFLSPLREQA